MLNREIYDLDPQQNRLENNGVAEVKDDQSQQALKTLRYELQTFVCDGEYQAGLDKILLSRPAWYSPSQTKVCSS